MKDPVRIESMFASIAECYDIANHVLSFGMDYFWRRELVKSVGKVFSRTVASRIDVSRAASLGPAWGQRAPSPICFVPFYKKAKLFCKMEQKGWPSSPLGVLDSDRIVERAGVVDLEMETELKNPIKVVCDLATGSGDVAFALKQKLGSSVVVRGYDFCEAMLTQAKLKRGSVDVEFYKGDCMELPLEDSSVDAITIAFGFRNLGERKRGLKEMYRVLKKPGGMLYVLEFSQPRQLFKGLYYFYLQRILPFLAWVTTGNREAYKYLASSIDEFPDCEEIKKELTEVGFQDVQIKRMTGGIVALHQGRTGSIQVQNGHINNC